MICKTCGQLQGIEEYDAKLWELHSLRRDGVQHSEALVFDSTWLQENIIDDDDMESLDHTMSKDMHNRGLCPTCGRPALAGMNEEHFMTSEEAKELADLYAEQAAERRAGC